ncbi:MAG: hypothetical protein AAGA76_15125, partial [Pseudomonadota bacterium]
MLSLQDELDAIISQSLHQSKPLDDPTAADIAVPSTEGSAPGTPCTDTESSTSVHTESSAPVTGVRSGVTAEPMSHEPASVVDADKMADMMSDVITESTPAVGDDFSVSSRGIEVGLIVS